MAATSPAGWLPRTGISSGTIRSVIEYGLPLPFYVFLIDFSGQRRRRASERRVYVWKPVRWIDNGFTFETWYRLVVNFISCWRRFSRNSERLWRQWHRRRRTRCVGQDWLHGFPGLFTDTAERIPFLLSSFFVFHFLVVGYVWQIISWLISAFERTLK